MLTFDPEKRAVTLRERGLDFADAKLVFEGRVATLQDNRFDYGEDRFISAGFLRDRLVVIVWTLRIDARHIISMRYAHAKEQRRWTERMGGQG